MIAVSKNVCFVLLHNIVDKYNNPVHRITKMKSTDVTSDSYTEHNEDFNKTGPKFKNGVHVRISIIFLRGF